MRPIFVLFLGVLFSFSNSSRLTATTIPNNDDVEAIDGDSPLNIRNGTEGGKIKFTGLYIDVLLHIFEYLDLNDLLNVAEANSKLSIPASMAFRSRKAKLVITGANSKRRITHDYDYNPFTDNFEINNFKLILKTFKHFGGAIQRLDIIVNYISNETRAAIINQCVNKYASKSLNQLSLGSIYKDTLDQFTVPFEAVENLLIGIGKGVNENRHLPLNELFPKLRSLNLLLHTNTDYSPIVCEFPLLNNLSLYMSEDAWRREAQIFELLGKNRHIQSINVEFHRGAFVRFDLKLMNQLLVNLEHLSVGNFNIGNESVHFEHVKRLRWERSNSTSIDRLSFARLESLKIDEYRRHEFQVWSEFFRKNVNLSRLHMCLLDETGYLQLVDLTSNLPNLTKLTIIQCYDMIYIDVIGQLINNHRNLEKLIFWTDKSIKNEVNILREQFANEWNIKDVEFARWDGVSFERRTI